MSAKQTAGKAATKSLRERAKDAPEEVIEASAAVKAMLDHPGWAVFAETVKAREDQALKNMMVGTPTDSGAEYADFLGFMKGLRALVPTAEAIAELGPEIEAQTRELEVAGSAA